MTTYLGGFYLNDFNLFGRTYRVLVQAEPQFRSDPESISRFYIRGSRGDMVPLFGVLPLVVATGAASDARHALGTSVFGGMLAATVLGVLFIPVFFVGIERRTERRRRARAARSGQEQEVHA